MQEEANTKKAHGCAQQCLKYPSLTASKWQSTCLLGQAHLSGSVKWYYGPYHLTGHVRMKLSEYWMHKQGCYRPAWHLREEEKAAFP